MTVSLVGRYNTLDRLYMDRVTGKIYRSDGGHTGLAEIGALPTTSGTTGRQLIQAETRKNARDTIGLTTPVYYVDDYGSHPFALDKDLDGSELASDEAVQSAIDAMGTEPGHIVFGKGDYKVTTTKTLAYPGQGIIGQGMHGTRIEYTGTGIGFRVWDSTVPTNGSASPKEAGQLSGFKLTGWFNPNTNVTGLKIGDLEQVKIYDVNISGFWRTGDVGLHCCNRYTWSERARVDGEFSQNRTCILFSKDPSHPDTHSSWDYSWWRLSVNTSGDQNGIKFIDNTDMAGVNMSVVGNTTGVPLAGSGISGNTGVYLTVGKDDSDQSYFQGKLEMEIETNGAASPEDEHYDINVGSSNSAAARLISPGSSIVFTSYGAKPYRAGTASRWNTRVDGRISCASLGTVASPQSSRRYGVSASTSIANYDSSGTRYFDLGSGNTGYYHLLNNAQTFAWDPNSLAALVTPSGTGQSAIYILSLQQPASGAAGTVIWPGSVYWASGAPLLRTANNDTDIILLYTHEHTTFFGVHLNALSVVAVPSTATSTGIRGQQAFDSSWHYTCTATNTWRRVAIASW